MLLRIWWTMQVCTQACGKTASIASGNPVRPSTQATRTSSTPRWCRSLRTASQNFAPSVSCHQISSTSRVGAWPAWRAMSTMLRPSWISSQTKLLRRSQGRGWVTPAVSAAGT